MEYINKIIKEALKNIKNDEERNFLRELSTSLIPQLINDFSQKLDEIQNEVDNLFQSNNRYINTVPVNKEELENYKETLFPVLNDDIRVIKKDKKKKTDIYLTKIFLDMNYKEIENFKNHKLSAKLKNGNNYGLEVYAVQCQDYVEKEKELAEVFESNNIDWEVLYTPYSRRFFEIYAKKNSYEINYDNADIEIDYGKYTENIYENYFLAWNIEEKEVLADQISVENIKGRVYEHRIFSSNAKNDLVKIINGKIFRIDREKEKLFVYSDVASSRNWKVWNIKDTGKNTYTNLKFKVLGNSKINDFITRFKGNSPLRTRSESEIFEIINSFSDIKNLRLKSITVDEYTEKTAYSFDMNKVFNEKKTFKRNNRGKLNLYFECIEKDRYFTDELSYILSCIEYKYPEYEVKGITEWK